MLPSDSLKLTGQLLWGLLKNKQTNKQKTQRQQQQQKTQQH